MADSGGRIVCPKCHAVAHELDEACPACGWTFAGPVQSDAPPVAPQPVIVRQSRSGLRMFVGLIGLLLIVAAGLDRWSTAAANPTASAVQITQIYTEGAFFVLVILGVVVALYVAVRPD